jgi:Methyltransferase domain.
MKTAAELPLPGVELTAAKMPGHWLLARLGKRVLRPGGLELTRSMLHSLGVRHFDAVVEFAPGLGATTELVLDHQPASYIGIEENEAAANRIGIRLTNPRHKCLVASAADTRLPGDSATVVFGEAMLTMQGEMQKTQIVREAARISKPGGRYGIHELCLVPEDLDETIKLEIQHVLSQTIHVGARPLTAGQWRALLDAAGFNVRAEMFRPMRLLKPNRLIQDEGLWGAVRFAWNLWRDEEARRRVKAMHQIFMKYRQHLAAIMLVGIKRPDRRSRRHDPKEDVGGKDGWSDPADRLEMSWRRASFS